MTTIGFCVPRMALCLCVLLLPSLSALGQEHGVEAKSARPPSIEGALPIGAGAFLQLELASGSEWKRVAKNSTVEGRLLLPVFAGERVAIPAGTKLRLTIESVKKVSKHQGKWAKFGAAMVRVLNPLEEPRPAEYAIKLRKTEIDSARGPMAISATALLAGRSILVEQQRSQPAAFQDAGAPHEAKNSSKARQKMLLRLDELLAWLGSNTQALGQGAIAAESPRKTHAFLLTPLSASRSRNGDVFQAQTAEPVRLGETLFEAGSLMEGRVAGHKPPRILSRAGSLYLRIERITSSQGSSLAIAGTLSGVEVKARARWALDEEGMLRGLKPGVKNAVVDLSIAYAIGKVTDDIAETPIRAIVATLSDAAIANAARYFGLGASAVFLVTRHGRDVDLPRYAQIQIDFGRHGEDTARRTTCD